MLYRIDPDGTWHATTLDEIRAAYQKGMEQELDKLQAKVEGMCNIDKAEAAKPTARQELAEKFLHAALLDPMNMQEHTYQYLIDWLNKQPAGRLSHMAAVLKSVEEEQQP